MVTFRKGAHQPVFPWKSCCRESSRLFLMEQLSQCRPITNSTQCCQMKHFCKNRLEEEVYVLANVGLNIRSFLHCRPIMRIWETKDLSEHPEMDWHVGGSSDMHGDSGKTCHSIISPPSHIEWHIRGSSEMRGDSGKMSHSITPPPPMEWHVRGGSEMHGVGKMSPSTDLFTVGMFSGCTTNLFKGRKSIKSKILHPCPNVQWQEMLSKEHGSVAEPKQKGQKSPCFTWKDCTG